MVWGAYAEKHLALFTSAHHHSAMGIGDDIARVEQHIRDIEQRIERQRALIAQSEAGALPIDGPRNFLWFLKETLSLSRDHLARLLADEAIAAKTLDGDRPS